MENKKLQKYRRSFLGTVIVILTFLLLFGCNRDKNTDGNGKKSANISMEVTTSCTTSTTISTTSNLTTSSTTSSTTTTTTTAATVVQIQIETQTPTIAIVETESVFQIENVSPTTQCETNNLPITDYERILLRNVVANEYGSDWVSVPEKAKVVATVMNRVNSPSYPNTIEGVLTQPYQFSGYYASNYEWNTVTDSVREAVDYYFNHSDEFGSYTGFWGDGTYNHFY